MLDQNLCNILNNSLLPFHCNQNKPRDRLFQRIKQKHKSWCIRQNIPTNAQKMQTIMHKCKNEQINSYFPIRDSQGTPSSPWICWPGMLGESIWCAPLPPWSPLWIMNSISGSPRPPTWSSGIQGCNWKKISVRNTLKHNVDCKNEWKC